MRNKKLLIILGISILILTIFLYVSTSPIREFHKIYEYPEHINYVHNKSIYENSKKTIVIIADNKSTEIFDLIAPFYLFSSTKKANVYILAKDKSPIFLFKGLFLLPHFSFKEFENTNIKTDAIIIPNLSAMEPESQNPVIIEWIKKIIQTQPIFFLFAQVLQLPQPQGYMITNQLQRMLLTLML